MTDFNLDRFRFLITDEAEARWSDVWFVEGRGDSVYVSSRKLGGSLKLSLHPRGSSADGNDSQFGHPWFYAEKEREAGNEPMPRLRWARPAIREQQFLPVARVLFPTACLGPLPKLDSDGKLKIALPKAPNGQATEVSILCSRGDPQVHEDKLIAEGFTPFTYYTLGADEYASVVARHVPFDGTAQQAIEKLSSAPASPLIGAPGPNEVVENARAIFVDGYPENGEPLTLIEVGPLRVANAAKPIG